MRFKTVGNKVDKAFIVVRNSSTVTIPNGAPCYFTMAAVTTNPNTIGIDVSNVASAFAVGSGIGQNFFAGIVCSEQQAGAGNLGLNPGSYGEAQVWGFVQSLRLVAQTRASSSASFSTNSGAIGDILAPATGTLALTQVTGSATTLGLLSPSAKLLAVVNDFRTANWLELFPYPELIMKQSDKLLAMV